MEYKWYKNKDTDQIWWSSNPKEFGSRVFSFDKVKVFRLWGDYPKALTPEQKEIFDKENPFWADALG